MTKDIKSGVACYWKQLDHIISSGTIARSSTQAELHAIILCLQNAPYESHLKIHTDSQGVIQSINQPNPSAQKEIRNNFAQEIQEIKQLIKDK